MHYKKFVTESTNIYIKEDQDIKYGSVNTTEAGREIELKYHEMNKN